MRPVDCNSFEVKGLFYVFGRLLELRQRKRQGTEVCLLSQDREPSPVLFITVFVERERGQENRPPCP